MKLIIPIVLAVILIVAIIFTFTQFEKASTVHNAIFANTGLPRVLILNPIPGASNLITGELEISCNTPFVLTQLSIDTTIGGGDNLDITTIRVDKFALTDGDAPLTAINLSDGAPTRTNPLVVPLSIDAMGAAGELDFRFTAAGGAITDADAINDIRAVVIAPSTAQCAISVGAQD